MTVTIEGSLEGPPPFDPAAFKATLAQKLDMRDEHFSVRRVKSKRSRNLHEVQSSRADDMRITVDVDEEGYLRHVRAAAFEPVPCANILTYETR